MPVSLERSQRKVHFELGRLEKILDDMEGTAASRYALAEIVLIRAAAVFEQAIADIAYKVACGAAYQNNSREPIEGTYRSMLDARAAMLSDGGARSKPRSFLRWTKAKYIKQSTSGVIEHEHSHYLGVCESFGNQISEVFAVRNHAAHRNTSSRANFMIYVERTYGHKRRIAIGYFLVSTNLTSISKIHQYLTSIRVIIDDIVAGPS